MNFDDLAVLNVAIGLGAEVGLGGFGELRFRVVGDYTLIWCVVAVYEYEVAVVEQGCDVVGVVVDGFVHVVDFVGSFGCVDVVLVLVFVSVVDVVDAIVVGVGVSETDLVVCWQ